MKTNKFWTIEKLAFLKDNVNYFDNVDLGKYLKCNSRAISYAMTQYNIKRTNKAIIRPHSKLEKEDILFIRECIFWTTSQLARYYDISPGTISDIKSKRIHHTLSN